MTERPEVPPGGGNRNDGGVQVVGSTVHGHVAGGRGATVSIGAGTAAAAGPGGPEGLRTAAEALRTALARLRAEQPGAVPAADAEDADAALAQILDETALDEPREGPLRRRVRTVADALRSVAVLAAAVSGLEAAFGALFGQS
ncbi:hypothetical protein ACFVFS_04860 [Kitasatospora sp. NPDC057692]|uniref:hypothetical protein n=1 Tax=Kitasatospora sp. NPDC057692 TaxID=3346215 RepID=UPI0036A951E6